MEKYRAYLESECKRAVDDFEAAKKESIECIQKISAARAADFGACYASYVDKITAAASRVMTLSQAIRMLNVMSE